MVDRVALLSHGRMLWEGPAAEACCHLELFERAGIKAPENVALAQALAQALGLAGRTKGESHAR